MAKEEHEAHKVAVKDYQFTENMTVDELVGQMEAAWGFTAGKLATGVNIMEAMINDKKCVKFLSFTADIVATGTRGVIRELVKRKLVDIIITTCGTLDHDVARCTKDYYRGSFIMSDSQTPPRRSKPPRQRLGPQRQLRHSNRKENPSHAS